MDVEDAAAYAGVPLVILAAAVSRGELIGVSTQPPRSTWMVRARDVEVWAECRANQPG